MYFVILFLLIPNFCVIGPISHSTSKGGAYVSEMTSLMFLPLAGLFYCRYFLGYRADVLKIMPQFFQKFPSALFFITLQLFLSYSLASYLSSKEKFNQFFAFTPLRRNIVFSIVGALGIFVFVFVYPDCTGGRGRLFPCGFRPLSQLFVLVDFLPFLVLLGAFLNLIGSLFGKFSNRWLTEPAIGIKPKSNSSPLKSHKSLIMWTCVVFVGLVCSYQSYRLIWGVEGHPNPAAEADLRNLKTTMEAYYADLGRYPQFEEINYTCSRDITASVVVSPDRKHYYLIAFHKKGTRLYTTASNTTLISYVPFREPGLVEAVPW